MHRTRSLLLLLGWAMVWPAPGQERAPYVWAATGKLITPRVNACAVSLPDGRVLVAGGDGADGALSSVEWYGDDAVFHQAAPMARARTYAACAALPDGRVLVAGGKPGSDGPGAEIYDPIAGQWQAAANEPLSRWRQSASVLSHGRVLLAGGESDAGATAALEVFDPFTNSFVLLSSTLSTPRTLHAAAVLKDDHVLIVGGSDGRFLLNTSDLVNVETGEVTPLPNLKQARADHSATTLLDGTVLLAGGRNGLGDLASSLIYLPSETRFLDGPALNTPRSGHAALRIPGNGNVLLVGGSSGGGATGSTEVYDFVLAQFVPAGPLTLARLGLAAAAQGDQGVVLAVGGATAQGPVAACGTLTSPTLTATKPVYLDTENATLNGAHYGSQESVVFMIQRTLNGASSTISIPSLITTSAGTFQTTIASQSAGSSVIVGALGVHTNLSSATSYIVGASTTTTLSITPAAGVATAQPVTLSVQVHPASIVGALRGTVSFFDGSTLLGSILDGKDGALAVDANQNGSGTFVFSPGAGTHSIRAEFSSKGFYRASSSGPQSYTVTKRDPAIAVTASPDTPRLGGAPIILQAVVTSAGGVPLVRPSGAIAWAEVTAQGTTVPLGVTALTAVSGFAGLTNVSAQISVATGTTFGTRLFKATYSGDDNYLARNDGVNVNVQRSLTSLSTLSLQFGSGAGADIVPLASNSLFAGDHNLFQATLNFTKVNGAVPTGKAFLRSDSATIVSRDVSLFIVPGTQSASILLPFTFTGPGQLNLRIDYEGDAEFEPASTSVVPVTVGRQFPRLQLTHPTAVGAGDPNVRIDLQTDFDPVVGFAPTGTVQVFHNSETTPVASGTLAAISGVNNMVVSFTLPHPPSSGTETYRVAYLGDNIFTPLTVTTGPIFSASGNNTPTMILTYHPILDSQPDFEITVNVRNSTTSPPTQEGGVVQAFRNDGTTAEDTEVLAAGKCVFHLSRHSGSGSDTFRFVFTGSDPTVQGMTPPIH